MEPRRETRSAPQRPAHPVMRELLGGLELSHANLLRRTDAQAMTELAQMLSNAEYWLSFDLAAFEPLLAKSPSPLRELGVAVLLRFGEGIDGSLASADLARAKTQLGAGLPPDLAQGIAEGLLKLERGVQARDSVPELEAQGFKRYAVAPGVSVHALRAMGRANIQVNVGGNRLPDQEKRVEVPIGQPILLSATDERGKPLAPPDLESHLDAPLFAKEQADLGQRTVVLLVPGEYVVRVPGRAAGDRKLVAG